MPNLRKKAKNKQGNMKSARVANHSLAGHFENAETKDLEVRNLLKNDNRFNRKLFIFYDS